MKRRKSYLTNFPTSTLFIVLEQNINNLLELEAKQLILRNSLLKERIKQAELTINLAKTTIIERYLNNGISLTEIANLLIKSIGIKENVFQELFTLKLLESNEIISIDLLEKAIDKLDISQLMLIMRTKQNTIYGNIATNKYDKMIFDVEPDVLEEYILKKRLDKRKEC